MVAALPDFLICTHLHCFPFMASIPLPTLHSFAPIVSPILRDSPPLPLSYCHRSIPLLYSCVIVISIPTPVLQFSLRPRFTVFLASPFTVFLTAFLVPLSYSFPLFPCLTVFLLSPFWLRWPLFLIWTPSHISNVHHLLVYKLHIAGQEGASLFLFVLQSLLTVQSMDKFCISRYLAIHHFCYYIIEQLPTSLCPVQWYCYLSCVLLGIFIYWDILVLKVYLVSKQVSC